ncbi:MAG: hypothetical protein M3R13_05725 [Armatimonadota bacterium]|nr:hypothetical protein [Armatimonadota bacterium]
MIINLAIPAAFLAGITLLLHAFYERPNGEPAPLTTGQLVRRDLLRMLVAFAVITFLFQPNNSGDVLRMLASVWLLVWLVPPMINLCRDAIVEYRDRNKSMARRYRTVKVLTGLTLIASAVGINNIGPAEKDVLESIRAGVTFREFLRDHTRLDREYYVYHVWQWVPSKNSQYPFETEYGNFEGGPDIEVYSLHDLRDHVKAGSLDSSKFSGTIILRRMRWFNGDTAVEITFINGKLYEKSVSQVFLGSILDAATSAS